MKLNKILMIAIFAISTTGVVERIYAKEPEIWATFDEKRLIDIWNGKAEEASTYGKGVKVIKIDRARLEADGLEMRSGSIVEKSTGRIVKGINIYGEGKVTYEVVPEKSKSPKSANSNVRTKITIKDSRGKNPRTLDIDFRSDGDLDSPEAEAAFKAALIDVLGKVGLQVLNGEIVDRDDNTIKYGNFEDFYRTQLAKAKRSLKAPGGKNGESGRDDGYYSKTQVTERGSDGGHNDIDDMYDYGDSDQNSQSKNKNKRKTKDRSETGIDESDDTTPGRDRGSDEDDHPKQSANRRKSSLRVTTEGHNDIDDMYDYGDTGKNSNPRNQSSKNSFTLEWRGKSGLGDSDLSDLDFLIKHRKPSGYNAQVVLEYLQSGDRSLADIKAKLRELYPNADESFIDALARLLLKAYSSGENQNDPTFNRTQTTTTKRSTKRSSSSGDDAYMRSLLGDDYDLVFGPGDVSISIEESSIGQGLDDTGIAWSDAQKERLSRLLLKIINSGDARDLDSIKAKIRAETGITDENQLDQLARLVIKIQNGKGPRNISPSDISIDTSENAFQVPGKTRRPGSADSNSSISISTTSGNGYTIIAERDWGAKGKRLQVQKPSGGFEFLEISVNEKGESIAKDSAGNEYVKVNGVWGFKNSKVISPRSPTGPSAVLSPEERASIETLEILIKSGVDRSTIDIILPGFKPKDGNYRGLYGTSGSGKLFYHEFENQVPVSNPAKVREEVDNLLKN